MIRRLLIALILLAIPAFDGAVWSASIDALTEETAPAGADIVYLGKNTGPGVYLDRKTQVSNLVPVSATTTEVTAGVNTDKFITPDALNGAALTPDSFIINKVVTDSIGSPIVNQSWATDDPAFAATINAILTANESRCIVATTETVVAPGHCIAHNGVFNYSAPSPNVFPLGIGNEGLVQVSSTGTLTEGDGLVSHVFSNQGTIITANGAVLITSDNDGLITTFNGVDFRIFNDTGTITSSVALNVGVGVAGAGTITNLTGLKFADQTAFANVKLIDNADPQAEIETAGDIVMEGATSGSVTVDVPAVAGANTVTLPAATGTVALNTMTTKGDLLVYGTARARLPVGTNGQVLTADSAEAFGAKWAGTGSKVVQIVEDPDTATNSGTGTFTNWATTPPPETEGNNYLSRTITPASTSNTLVIDWSVKGSMDQAGGDFVACWVYQDTVSAGDLAIDAVVAWNSYSTFAHLHGSVTVTAPSTSEITYKVNCGVATPGSGTRTFYFNQVEIAGPTLVNVFGAATQSYLRVTEFRP